MSRTALERVRSDWQQLGRQDPLWAVLVNRASRGGGWSTEDFLATGRAEMSAVFAHLRDLGRIVPGGPGSRGLDFGCGAGRLTLALAEHLDYVVGVDVSASMLEVARHHDVDNRCSFVLNERADLTLFEDSSFDLIVSSLVLQHLPSDLAVGYLRELARVARPGGLLIIQVAREPGRNLRGMAARILPMSIQRAVQKQVLRYPAPMDMHALGRGDLEAAAGDLVQILDEIDEPMYGGHWRYSRFYLRRTGDLATP